MKFFNNITMFCLFINHRTVFVIPPKYNYLIKKKSLETISPKAQKLILSPHKTQPQSI